jgi:hypothetical protein
MDRCIPIELIDGPFLKAGGSPAEYRTGLDLAQIVPLAAAFKPRQRL